MISLLVVNYRSAALAVEAIRSARATTSPLQVVVVDNSCDSAEAERLRGHADELLVSSSNRGYAGAINDGRRLCRGKTIVVSNPDVTFGADALDRLAASLDRFAVAGPALFWDEQATWILPPSDLHTGRDMLGKVLASRIRPWRIARDRSRIRERIAFWSVATPVRVPAISGAVMAIRADVFDAHGGFDERFALYFEEDDFLRRVQQRRQHIAYVPAARCRHVYNQSAAADFEHASRTFAESETKYLAKWNGPWAARMLKRFERPLPAFEAQPLHDVLTIDAPDEVVVEATPLPSFETAAGHFPRDQRVEIPAEVWHSFRSEMLYLRVVDRRTAHVRATYARYKS